MKKNIGKILNAISGIILVLVGVWFIVSCMQVANQTIAPWNFVELLF